MLTLEQALLWDRHQGQDCPWLGCRSSYLEWCSSPGHPRRASCRERRLRSADPFRVSHPHQAHRQRDVLSHPVGPRAQQRTSGTHTMADTRNNLAATEMALPESVYQERSHCAHRQLLQTHLSGEKLQDKPKRQSARGRLMLGHGPVKPWITVGNKVSAVAPSVWPSFQCQLHSERSSSSCIRWPMAPAESTHCVT